VLSRNYWVFFYVTVFFGSIAAFAVSGFAKAAYLMLTHAPPSGNPVGDYLIVLALLSFGEATLNGFVLATATIFRPEWVASIDEGTYAAKAV
jgi:uncharacterized membrane protein